MAKGVLNKESIELAVSIQGNIAGIVGLSGEDALDLSTKKQLVEQTTEAIINSNLSIPNKDGSIPLLKEDNAKTVGLFAEMIVEQTIKEISSAIKGVDMSDPDQVTKALLNTSISRAASPEHSPRLHFRENAVDMLHSAVKFCEAVNQGNNKAANVLAGKVSPSPSRDNSPSR